MAASNSLFDDSPSSDDTDSTQSTQLDEEWSDASDEDDDETPEREEPRKDAEDTNNKQLFATPQMQSAVHVMLTHLQEWWEHSEGLLQMMAAKKLPCASIKKMSDEIDTMLDKSISKLIETYSSDPSAFPISALVGTTRAIKKYLFLKVGEVCCQAGREDACAKMANVALVSLKKFRNSATDFYDQLLANLVQSMETSTATQDGEEFTTPDLQNLLAELSANPQMTGNPQMSAKSAKSAKPTKSAKPAKQEVQVPEKQTKSKSPLKSQRSKGLPTAARAA